MQDSEHPRFPRQRPEAKRQQPAVACAHRYLGGASHQCRLSSRNDVKDFASKHGSGDSPLEIRDGDLAG